MVTRAIIMRAYRGWRLWRPRWMLLCPDRRADVNTWFAVGEWRSLREAEQARQRLQRELDGGSKEGGEA